MIGVLKSLGLLTEDGVPTQRNFEFLDQTQGGRVLAEGVLEAYSNLFEINTNAQKMSRDLKNKMRSLSQGRFTDAVLDKMAMTFTALVKNADFEAVNAVPSDGDAEEQDEEGDGDLSDNQERPSVSSSEEELRIDENGGSARNSRGLNIDGLVYNIQIQLPESRDPKVYDALFESLAKHLNR